MKPGKFLTTIKYSLLITAAALISTSCENKKPEESQDATKQAAKENDIKFENKKQEKDAQFLVDATAFNLEQIQLAHLGEQKGTADIKDLSQMMLTEHEKMLPELQKLAKDKQVTVPDSASADAFDNYNMLKDKNGDEFNKSFCDRLVETHKKAVGVFEKESADSRDQDLKEYATTKLPDLRKHLDHIFACQKKTVKM
jgi:putative membrane protein